MGSHRKSNATTEWGMVIQSGKYSNQMIAKLLGVDHSSVSHWICGKYIPNGQNLNKICKLYGIKISEGTRMFERDHKKFLECHADKTNTVVEPTSEPDMSTEDVTTETVDTSHVHKIVFRAGESHKVVVRPTNALKQLFGTLVDANVDIASICNVLSAYDQFNGDLIEMLNFIYLKVTAEDYRKIFKAVDPMLK